MASLTRLRRRLLRWERYAAKVGFGSFSRHRWQDVADTLHAASWGHDIGSFPVGCTGHYRGDDELTHVRPCPVHIVGCSLACLWHHTYRAGCTAQRWGRP